uniref:(northern house mosquito) hypothetical protein n=1 Tax=Culex pipiens TaxID=7175 RepID=A0A8D8H3L2_CULPI
MVQLIPHAPITSGAGWEPRRVGRSRSTSTPTERSEPVRSRRPLGPDFRGTTSRTRWQPEPLQLPGPLPQVHCTRTPLAWGQLWVRPWVRPARRWPRWQKRRPV